MKKPKKAQEAAKKAKDKKRIVEERDTEDWCFACKDGGELILCDHDDCPKVYHQHCVEKDESAEETGDKWTCKRHSCSECHNTPWYYCYCCPTSVCRRCVSSAEFLPVRGRNGLCDECWEIVRIVEGEEYPETDGDKIDLKDRNTYECLFLEYWEIIKEKEGLILEDVHAAEARSKKRKYTSKSSKVCKRKDSDELTSSDSDSDDTEEHGVTCKRKNSMALEFVGWGSKPLIKFLTFLGKDTTEPLSQRDVESIICKYVQEKKLSDQRKRKKIVCDKKLYSIFQRRSIQKNNMFNLLGAHFSANLEQSDESGEDEVETIFPGKKDFTTLTKKPKTEGSTKLQDMEEDIMYQESCFASIVAENIKLVYLRRSLIEELLHEPEGFEDKVVGSFVRLKVDPKDYMKRNSHQLLQVTGIKQNSTVNDGESEILFQVSNMPTGVHISMLSDSDFCEEEIVELRQKIEEDLLPKITVVELEEKAIYLHKDVTKHWIQKELVRLQNRIDFANEKGWRREMVECLARRESLKKPSEQERLLQESPKVIAERIVCKTKSADSLQNDVEPDASPKSILKDIQKSPSR